MSLPLEGIRVLDLSRLLPGGFCSLLLADFGADVVKIEDTGMGDYIRWSPPYYEGTHDSAKSALFLSLNRNKRSVRLDLKSDGGREALLALVRDADVVLDVRLLDNPFFVPELRRLPGAAATVALADVCPACGDLARVRKGQALICESCGCS